MDVAQQPRQMFDGKTVDELVSEIKRGMAGGEGLIRDWSQKSELEILVEKERVKQEKKRAKRAAKATRIEIAKEPKLSDEERKKLERARLKAAEREEKQREKAAREAGMA